MKGTVHYRVEDNVAILTCDNPPVNPLSAGIRQGLHDHVSAALAEGSIKAMVITGAGNAFIAGADISEFGGEAKGAGLHDVLRLIEFSHKPIVAAVNGVALGGGLEVALACHYRVGLNAAFIGLPEVNLGLLPGAGGTQRLPRLIGAQAALNIMLTGSHVQAGKALEWNVLDDISDGDVVASAIQFGLKKAKAGEVAKVRSLTKWHEADKANIDTICDQATALVNKARKGQTAPLRIIECVRQSVTLDDFDEGLKVEGKLFLECLNDPQRAAMIHVFFSERQVAKIPDIERDTPLMSVKKVAIIGSGTMGGGIAMCFANAGIATIVLDQNEENLKRGMAVIQGNYDSQVKRKRISQEARDKCMSLLTPTLTYDDLSEVDMVVEAVYENLELKCQIFEKLNTVTKPEAILASNTSALDIDRIAMATDRPELVIGTHFFSPANVMRLLEVVRGEKSSKSTIATCMKLGKKLGKISVLAGNCPGFIGNRMIARYSRQAQLLILEGAKPIQVDTAIKKFGLNMGPFAMSDLVGLDLGWRARKMAGGSNEITVKITDALCEQGRFGQKNGKGYYLYEEGSRVPIEDPEVMTLIEQVSDDLGFTRRSFDEEEIIKRCIYPLINEGAKILEDGMAIRGSDIDIVYNNGYGFPNWRGGPMFYANTVGLENVLADLKKFEAEHGDFWKPAALLEQLVADGKNFS